MATVYKTTFKLRRGTMAEWKAKNPILSDGEPGFAIDKNILRIGDGKTAWKDLPDINGSGTAVLEVLKIYDDPNDTSTTVNGQTYDTPAEAIAAAGVGDEVIIQNSLGSETVSVDKEITINLGETVTVNNDVSPMVITATGKTTLKNGGLECNKNGEPAITVNGEAILDNCNLSRTVDEKNNTYYTCVNHGKMIINSGVFSAPGVVSSMIENGYWTYNSGDEKTGYVAGRNQPYPELIVNGGSFFNNFYIIKNDDGSKLTINGGEFYGTILHNGIEMIINDGHFTTTDGYYPLSIRNLSDDLNPARTIINGGTFDGNCKTIIANIGEKPLDVQVKGGKFILALDEQYIAEGYEQKFVDGWYIVTKKGE